MTHLMYGTSSTQLIEIYTLDILVQLLLQDRHSCERHHPGGTHGMSEVQRHDDVGTVL
ncbi:hypothetical protein NSPZN2_40222 [Nitrospira defluvii]|uniref:Uncharacterized protein n=1 Tax=Nitrospira defluvii TaxID=330214 RepID=A0ABN7LVG3_9BACT|nr:hypothetical protein NSPZN2_40222 [Nitrospira defluvii]